MPFYQSTQIFVLPAILLGFAFWSQTNPLTVSTEYQALLDYLPLLVLSISAGLGVFLKQSQALFCSLVIAIAYVLWAPLIPIPGTQQEMITSGLMFLLPLNLALFSSLKDRGVFTLSGKSQWVLIGVQITAIAMLPSLWTSQWLDLYRTPWFGTEYIGDLSQLALASWGLSIIFLLFRAIRDDNPIIAANLGGVISVGSVFLYGATETSPWLFFSTAAALLLVAVIQNSYRMSFVDQLTGLPNRRALENQFMRLPRRYTIAMLDVDHFKKFNDTYGHDVGDQVLKLVSSKMKKVGGGGRIARYGGEEFTIVFPRKSKTQCQEHLDTLRKSIEQSSFIVRKTTVGKRKRGTNQAKGKSVSVTISIGMCERDQGHKVVETVLKGADQALYRAKKAGRNCIR